MNNSQLRKTLTVVSQTARDVGGLLRRNLNAVKRVNDATAHDLKLELDVRCQNLIQRRLERASDSFSPQRHSRVPSSRHCALRM